MHEALALARKRKSGSTFHSKNHSAHSTYFYYGELHGKIVFVDYMIFNVGEAAKLEEICPYTLLQ